MLKSCEEDKILIQNRTNFPQSAFLFDHLVDVMMRRLAIDGNYDEVPLDEKAKVWREKIDQLGKAKEGSIPSALSRTYHKNWELQTNFLIPLYN